MLIMGACLAISLWAAPKAHPAFDDKGGADSVKKKKKMPVYLGKSTLLGGPISKRVFDSLLKQGVVARDSAGNTFHVEGFMFTYAELKLYEDAVGKLVWLTDYQAEYCNGDSISTNIRNSIFDRTKVGDTVYIDDIMLRNDKGIPFPGRPLRFEITSKN